MTTLSELGELSRSIGATLPVRKPSPSIETLANSLVLAQAVVRLYQTQSPDEAIRAVNVIPLFLQSYFQVREVSSVAGIATPDGDFTAGLRA